MPSSLVQAERTQFDDDGTTTAWATAMPSQPSTTNVTSPPPPPPTSGLDGNPFNVLPPGWTTAISPMDGRIYYWEQATGRTSWIHPSANTVSSNTALTSAQQQQQRTAATAPPPPPPLDDNCRSTNDRGINQWLPAAWTGGSKTLRDPFFNERHDTPLNAYRRPDNHQCYAVAALVLFFPVGLCACIHSYSVDQSWNAGRYGDAYNHSKQVKNYACLGCTFGILFWLYWFLFREESKIEWPDWKFD